MNPKVTWYFIAVTTGIAFVIAQHSLNYIWNLISSEQHIVAYDFDGLHWFTNINVIAVVILVPIAEELIFRETIQKRLQKNTSYINGNYCGVFALIHIPLTNYIFGYHVGFHHAYITLFGGGVAGYLYYRSKSIWVSIVFHMSWNAMATLS